MEKKPVETLLKEIKIREVINPRLVQAPPTISLAEAIRLMQERPSGYIVIAQDKRVVGIFTEVDVTRHVLGKNVDWKRPVSDFMTSPAMVLNPNDTIYQAIKLMGDHRFYHIPLVDEKNELVGVLSVRTLIRTLAAFYPTEVYNLPPVPDQIMGTPEGG